jgi:hypothetical protein
MKMGPFEKGVIHWRSLLERKIFGSGNAFLRATIVASGIAAFPLSVHAAAYEGYVTNVGPYNGTVYVVVGNGAFSGGTSSCPAGANMIFSIPFNPASDFGKSLMAVALSAKISGRLVYATGNGVCQIGNPYNGGGTEGLVFLDLKGQ